MKNLFKKKIKINREDFEALNIRVLYLENENKSLRDKISDLRCIDEAQTGEITTKNDYIKGLEQEINLLNSTIEELEKTVARQDAKLFCNSESKRQIRKLARDIKKSNKLSRDYIAEYLENISLYITGECK